MDGFVGRHLIDRGFASPTLRGCMVVDLGAVRVAIALAGVKCVKGGEVGKVNCIVAVDGDI